MHVVRAFTAKKPFLETKMGINVKLGVLGTLALATSTAFASCPYLSGQKVSHAWI